MKTWMAIISCANSTIFFIHFLIGRRLFIFYFKTSKLTSLMNLCYLLQSGMLMVSPCLVYGISQACLGLDSLFLETRSEQDITFDLYWLLSHLDLDKRSHFYYMTYGWQVSEPFILMTFTLNHITGSVQFLPNQNLQEKQNAIFTNSFFALTSSPGGVKSAPGGRSPVPFGVCSSLTDSSSSPGGPSSPGGASTPEITSTSLSVLMSLFSLLETYSALCLRNSSRESVSLGEWLRMSSLNLLWKGTAHLQHWWNKQRKQHWLAVWFAVFLAVKRHILLKDILTYLHNSLHPLSSAFKSTSWSKL